MSHPLVRKPIMRDPGDPRSPPQVSTHTFHEKGFIAMLLYLDNSRIQDFSEDLIGQGVEKVPSALASAFVAPDGERSFVVQETRVLVKNGKVSFENLRKAGKAKGLAKASKKKSMGLVEAIRWLASIMWHQSRYFHLLL
jgi:hypothetical protein